MRIKLNKLGELFSERAKQELGEKDKLLSEIVADTLKKRR